ncbi:MAG: ABC transporter substrate-binding protein [Pseudonocardiales bacterium]|nr:ABC transporter substrate-binding protein [Pseudonocardiales bacterium]MBV9028911.1 ABC transporter substrate-binding protein [Pseudonocardiales bacterium]MBW0009795.1 ABC transporter substrate-binding protein [Pseudonocardiales bacterium]
MAALIALWALVLTAGCGGGDGGVGAAPGPAPSVRLGYFANVTHAAAIIGVNQGFIARQLGGTALETQIFDAGPAEVEALFGGSLDAAYVGPNPAINAFERSDGKAVRIIAGATSGGAQLVVRQGINTVQDLRGKTLASPELGNTQDVALRAWLTSHGLRNSVQGGGDVTITPTANADTLQLFKSGKLDGAWVPEPWASRLVLEAGAKVLVDERDLWPGGRFVTTQLIVRTEFLDRYPQTVEALLRGHVEAVQWATQHPTEAGAVVNNAINALTGKSLKPEVVDRAWRNLTVTDDPIAASLQRSAENAVTAGVATKRVDLHGIYDLSILNRILTQQGLPTVSADGLGKE